MSKALRMTAEQFAAHQQRTRGMQTVDAGGCAPPVIVPNKHGAIPTVRGELRFDSKSEAAAWDLLEYRLAFGEITHLQRQVTFVFTVGGVRVGHYRADFVYRTPDGVLHVADRKSEHTKKLPGWTRTKKLMRSCYGIEIEEM